MASCMQLGSVLTLPNVHCQPQYMVCDVQEVKGAAWTAIASCVHSAETAAAAWERLLQECVLANAGRGGDISGGGGGGGDSSVAIPQYDMTYQLNEIEVGLPSAPSHLHPSLNVFS